MHNLRIQRHCKSVYANLQEFSDVKFLVLITLINPSHKNIMFFCYSNR